MVQKKTLPLARGEKQSQSLEALLIPIKGPCEVGTSVRYDPIFDQIIAARHEENQNLPQGIWKTVPKHADWQLAETLCRQVLTSKSKDLQIAGWLLEAQFNLKGIPGLLEGLDLIKELCLRFWDTLYPQLEKDGGTEFRLAPIEWINQKFSNTLLQVLVTSPLDSAKPRYSMADFIHAEHIEHLSRQPKYGAKMLEDAKKNGEITLDIFLQSRDNTEKIFYERLINTLNQALKAILQLDNVLMKNTKDPTSFLYTLRDKLISIKHLAEVAVEEHNKNMEQQQAPRLAARGSASEGASAAKGLDVSSGINMTSSTQPPSPAGPQMPEGTPLKLKLASHAQAYEYLEQILEYLKQTEVS